MKEKTLNEINEIYDLEITRVVKTIKRNKAKKVLLQFPEGMKRYSQVICEEIENQTNAECFIWLGTCFGACDIPVEVENLGVDLIVQFGHSKWKYGNNKDIRVLK
ncbi:2-(3-amino-3-carboxypropyl)histidine synthase [uncultured archaeon]|nr:2-(3-amino-3-carboxypropyl)histidine synthase [uncultured archaeon]